MSARILDANRRNALKRVGWTDLKLCGFALGLLIHCFTGPVLGHFLVQHFGCAFGLLLRNRSRSSSCCLEAFKATGTGTHAASTHTGGPRRLGGVGGLLRLSRLGLLPTLRRHRDAR